ncbi:MAG: DUF167 domain-containing protein [Patescibacteria group bacterium]|nr:DUF167 domain-containing protein [Patescibacteria group bacterium]MDD5567024.1 DUF167 domain-containing protein [Patescibacteria group bacterium]
MKVCVLSKPNSKKPRIEKLSDGNFIVAVKERAIENYANQAIIKALADYLKVPPTRVSLIAGRKSKNKVFEII